MIAITFALFLIVVGLGFVGWLIVSEKQRQTPTPLVEESPKEKISASHLNSRVNFEADSFIEERSPDSDGAGDRRSRPR